MKAVIVGYGRMGHLVEEVLESRGHEVLRRIDSKGSGDSRRLAPGELEGADGVIEFALAEGIVRRIRLYADAHVPAVVGTTGWEEHCAEARSAVNAAGGTLLRGSNFSLGAHLFFRFTAAAARLMNRAEEYDVSLAEYHHRGKADYPSGTAVSAAEGIIAELERKTHHISRLPEGPVPPDALQVASVRVGAAPGVHEMRMDSSADFLTIRHEARGREGFALGAVRALEWLEGKTGWHEADEFIDDLLGRSR